MHLARAGGCAILLPGERRPTEVGPELGPWPRVHARLALVEAGGRPPALRGGRSRGAALFWVTPSRSGSASAVRLDAAEAFVVAPLDDPGSEGSAFTVAGCGGRRLRRAARAGALATERAA
jgi:hypothetical protein